MVQKAIALLFEVKSIDMLKISQSKNVLEQMLETDPSGFYPKMNDVTRNLYRYKLCMTAIQKQEDELELAKNYIEQSRAGNNKHIGFFIYEDYDHLFKKKTGRKAVYSVAVYPPCIIFCIVWGVVSAFLSAVASLFSDMGNHQTVRRLFLLVTG